MSDIENQIVSQYKYLYNWLRSNRHMESEDAEDLAQNVMMKALRLKNTFDPRKATPSTWIIMIAKTMWIDWTRQMVKRPFILFNVDDDTPTYKETQLEEVFIKQVTVLAEKELAGNRIRTLKTIMGDENQGEHSSSAQSRARKAMKELLNKHS